MELVFAGCEKARILKYFTTVVITTSVRLLVDDAVAWAVREKLTKITHNRISRENIVRLHCTRAPEI